MKIYGFKKVKDLDKAELLEMQEVSFLASPKDIKEVAAFLLKTAKQMEKHGDLFGHEHFIDSQQKSEEIPDIIVVLEKQKNKAKKGRI